MAYEIAMTKTVLATLALILASAAAYAINATMGKVKCPGFCRSPVQFHRWLGRSAMLVVLVTTFVCIFYTSYAVPTLRTWIHAALGAAALALTILKLLVARGGLWKRDRLPLIGRTLYLTIFLIWASSALVYLLG